MSRERNAPAGRAAHPRPVGAPRAGSPPPPVPDALNHVPGHRKTERRKNNTPALGSGTGGIWFDALLFPSSFPAERNRRCGNGSACTSPPPPPPAIHPPGQGHEGEHRFNTDFRVGFPRSSCPAIRRDARPLRAR